MSRYPRYDLTEKTGKTIFCEGSNQFIQDGSDIVLDRITQVFDNLGLEVRDKQKNHLSNIISSIFASNPDKLIKARTIIIKGE